MKSHRRLMATALTALLAATQAAAADVSPPSSAPVAEEFRQTLLRLAQAGQLPADGSPVRIERPAERVVNLGLLVDRDSDDGLRVLGTLPGGSAERLGLRTGDRVVAANEVDLTGAGGSERMRGLLDGLAGDAVVAFDVLREGRRQRLAGRLDVVDLPAMRVAIGGADDAPDAGGSVDARQGTAVADPDSTCGRVSTFDVAPRNRDLFPALLIAVDGRQAGVSGQDSYRLTPGRHELTVSEAIDEAQFPAIANRQRFQAGAERQRTLSIDVAPGVTYLLAARLHRDRSTRIGDGGYWEPVIWSERAERCR